MALVIFSLVQPCSFISTLLNFRVEWRRGISGWGSKPLRHYVALYHVAIWRRGECCGSQSCFLLWERTVLYTLGLALWYASSKQDVYTLYTVTLMSMPLENCWTKWLLNMEISTPVALQLFMWCMLVFLVEVTSFPWGMCIKVSRIL